VVSAVENATVVLRQSDSVWSLEGSFARRHKELLDTLLEEMAMAKVGVGGSMSFDTYDLVKEVLDQLLVEGDIVLSGNAPGADRLGEEYARRTGLEYKIIPSEWDKHGLKATRMRNEVLLRSADFVICFWDGESEGAKHMLDIAKRTRKLLAEVRRDGYLRLFLNSRRLP
jgi:hypothetical protein